MGISFSSDPVDCEVIRKKTIKYQTLINFEEQNIQSSIDRIISILDKYNRNLKEYKRYCFNKLDNGQKQKYNREINRVSKRFTELKNVQKFKANTSISPLDNANKIYKQSVLKKRNNS